MNRMGTSKKLLILPFHIPECHTMKEKHDFQKIWRDLHEFQLTGKEKYLHLHYVQ